MVLPLEEPKAVTPVWAARLLDGALWLAWVFGLCLVWPATGAELLEHATQRAALTGLLALGVPAGARIAMLALRGTTPGQASMGVRLLTHDGYTVPIERIVLREVLIVAPAAAGFAISAAWTGSWAAFLWLLGVGAVAAFTGVPDAIARLKVVRDLRQPVVRCHKCGYPLYGLESNRCPECGTSFPPSRRPDEPPGE